MPTVSPVDDVRVPDDVTNLGAMRVLITGAGGMLGSDVRQAAEDAGLVTIPLTRAALDICDEAAVVRAVSAARPDVVINCAAWTAVDAAETHAEEADAINRAGAGHVAAAAAAVDAWTIHVSTDYVFDGRSSRPYVESDPVAPASVYGETKLAGERSVACAAPGRHTIVRTSWLFGLHGPCFPRTIQRLATERNELRVVEDQIGCPTFTGHLATALVGLAQQPRAGILHVTGSGACSWYTFAKAIVAASGLTCDVVPIGTDQYPTPAQRPAFSVLGSERGAPLLPDWELGLQTFVSKNMGVTA